jgi:AraC-like DNA-binding protein
LQEVLRSSDFSEWEAVTRSVLGHHRSLLLGPASTFSARYRLSEAGPLQTLHIQGSGELELEREQCGCAVLWIPLRGISEERVNGHRLEIGPGNVLLIRPGDQLLGRTAPHLEGLSVLLPDTIHSKLATHNGGNARHGLLLGTEAEQQRLTSAAIELLKAVQRQDRCRAMAAQALLEHVEILSAPSKSRQLLGERRRWQLVVEASRWMEARLQQPFGIAEIAGALACPPRTLQDAFARELGRSPLAQARLLRLRALRRCLQDQRHDGETIASLMGRCGLLACGATARAYAACFGELPRATRARRRGQ